MNGYFKRVHDSGKTAATTRLKNFISDTAPPSITNPIFSKLFIEKSPFLKAASQNFIFIHIPKTAGSSVINALSGDINAGHCRIADYYLFDAKLTSNLFKFAFVRNPWDRFQSAFNYLKSGSSRTERDINFSKRAQLSNMSLDEFCERLEERPYRNLVLEYDHFRSQSFWIKRKADNNTCMDFIGRFENLNEDFNEVCNHIFQRSITLSSLRTTPPKDFRMEFSERSKNFVNQEYGEDIELFKYRFQED